MNDKNCYVCQKDTLKKYICKDCYFKVVRENEELKKKLSTIVQQPLHGSEQSSSLKSCRLCDRAEIVCNMYCIRKEGCDSDTDLWEPA